MKSSACLFCRIVEGTEDAYRVLDDEVAHAFLDIRPLFPGHVLCVPKLHVETLADLPADLVGPLFSRAQLLCRALTDALGCAGSFVAVNNIVSQSVPHLHIHVVPRNRKDGLRGFFWPRTRYDSPQDAEAMAARIAASLVD